MTPACPRAAWPGVVTRAARDSEYDHEKVCIDFKNRRDFLHSISRNWREVTWVAGASYLTRTEARKRFKEYSGDEYQEAEYRVDKESKNVGGADNRERAKFWEIWDKGLSASSGWPRVSKRSWMKTTPTWICEVISLAQSQHTERCSGVTGPVPDVHPVPRPARGNKPADRPHSRAVGCVGGQGFLSGRRRRGGDAIQTAMRIHTPA